MRRAIGILWAAFLGIGCRPSVQTITLHNDSSHNVAIGEVNVQNDSQAFRNLQSHHQLTIKIAPRRKGAVRVLLRFDNGNVVEEESAYVEPTFASTIDVSVTDENRLEWRQTYPDK